MATQVQIPPVKTGIDFLASSHFNIGNIQETFRHKSTFQNDYTLQNAERVSTIQKPPPATMMHGDHRVNEQCSVNKEQFCNPNGFPEKNPINRNTLTKTNFKMDHDSRVETFKTTNNIYHSPKSNVGNAGNVGNNVHALNKEPMKSFIPQGDKSKEICTKSLYKEDFPRKSVKSSTKDMPVSNLSDGASMVLKGDLRSHAGIDMFGTTSRRELPPYYGHSKAIIPDDIHYPKTSIPSGNELNLQSTHQRDYPNKLPPITTSLSYERKKSADLLKTQFVNGDKRLNNFKSVGHDYGDFEASDATVAASLDMRTSNFPPGDGIPVAGRKETTMNSTHFKAPPANYRNPIVDGSNRHTASNVDFGKEKTNYNTMTKSTFQHKQGESYSRMKNESMQQSFTLHENNLGSNDNVSSYGAAFKSTLGVKKLAPNPIAIENLKKSYIVEPIRGLREFSTTQRESYTPKERSFEKVNTHHLHRSSVPIGSMSR